MHIFRPSRGSCAVLLAPFVGWVIPDNHVRACRFHWLTPTCQRCTMASIIQLINTHPVAAAAAAAIAVYVLARRMMPLFPNAARPATRDPVEAYGYTEEVKAVTREERRVVDGVAPAASPAQKRAALAYHRL